MADNHETHASCLCGSISFSYTGPPLGVATELCHCVSCQKWTGGAFTSNITIERHHFQPPRTSSSSSLPVRYTTTGASGNKIHFIFCGACGSGLWNEPEATPQWLCIKAGTIDDESVRNLGMRGQQQTGGISGGKHVDVEFFTKDRVAYLRACEGARQEKMG